MTVTANDVTRIMAGLVDAGISPRISGGWGIDALIGRATRPHRDLDLSLPNEQLSAALAVLAESGFVITTDWLPVRVELFDGRRYLDLHPLNYRPDGSAWQAALGDSRFEYPVAGWTSGMIDGSPVRCLSAEMQRSFHAGYEPRAVDLHDLQLLDSLDAP